MSHEAIAIFMFISMLLMLLTGQRVFAAIGVVATIAALLLWGDGAIEMPFNAAFKLFNWYPLLTLPLFIYMGYILSESGIADDLYAMFHVWFGGLKGGLAVGTIMLMVVIAGSYIVSQRRNLGQSLQYAAIWGFIFLGAILAVGAGKKHRRSHRKIHA